MSWSPDGKRVRLILREGNNDAPSDRLWEVNLTKKTVSQVLPGWSRPPDQEYGGEWTPDRRFFILPAYRQRAFAIWAVRERSGLLEWRQTVPVRLTDVQEKAVYVAISQDGKKVFADVDLPKRCEVMRNEPATDHFLPYIPMAGVSAGQLAFSPEGKEATYATYPDMNIWKMNTNGSNRIRITSGLLRGALPQGSPDGQWVAFMGWEKINGRTTIRVVSADGGKPEAPVQWPGWQGGPSWASGGDELIFGENGPTFPIPASCSLHVFDFRSGTTTDLPGTVGLWTARTCPTGRYVAALTNDNGKLVLYDRRAATRTDLLPSPEGRLGDNPVWSADGQFVYIDVPFSRDPAIYRIGIADKRVQRVAGLTGLRRTTTDVGSWIGLTPDGSLLTLRELQGTEIYSWDFVAP